MSKLYRSRRDKKVTGLCGGLAETLNIDATLLRLLVVITAFFSGGTVIFLYFVAAIVIPKEPGFDQPPHDPYAGHFGRNDYAGGWNRKPYESRGPVYSSSAGPSSNADYTSSSIDEMMKDIEKKALQKEIEQLRAKVAQFEKNNEHNKGDV